jgi:phage shock protein PspC (stress-responsive transcriptional regulator)
MWATGAAGEAGAMSQTTAPTPSPPRQPHRSADDRKLLGVCGGFAEAYGLDPLVVRIAVAVLALFGGLGIVLYLAGAAWLPEPGDNSDILSSRRLPMLVVAVLAAVIILPSLVFPFGDGAGFVVTAGLLVLIILLLRRPTDTTPPAVPPEAVQPIPQPTEATDMPEPFPETDAYEATPYPPEAATPYPPAGYPPTSAPPTAYPAPPQPPRARSYLGALTLSIAVVWFGAAWALNATDATAMSAVTIFGVTLAILGAGILVGAWVGRARWLVLLALPLSLMVWGLSAVPESVRLGEAVDWATDGFGETEFRPEAGGDDDYSWGFGSAALDVADWNADTGPHDVTASVGVGELVITVPDSWNVIVDAAVGLGSIRAEGGQVADGGNLAEVLTFEAASSGAPQMRIDASVDLGEIRIITTDQPAVGEESPALTPEESA